MLQRYILPRILSTPLFWSAILFQTDFVDCWTKNRVFIVFLTWKIRLIWHCFPLEMIFYYPGFAGFQRSSRLVDPACVSTTTTTTPKITPADSKRLHNHSTEVAEIFVGCLLIACHEIPTRHRMKYSLSRSESEFEQVTARVQVDSHVKDQSWLGDPRRCLSRSGWRLGCVEVV